MRFLELFFRKRKPLSYRAAMNLVYDKNILTLRKKVKILIVDDERFDIVDILKERQYHVYYKKDITYAIEAEPFDIVIIDIIGIAEALRSNMGGFAIAEEIKRKYPAKQVWCYSGSTIKQDVASRIKRIDGYISKDSDVDQWCEKLDGIIETYCGEGYQIEILKTQLKTCGVSDSDIDAVVREYKSGWQAKNFNVTIDLIMSLISNGTQVLEIIKQIYSFAEHYTS